MTRFSTIAIAAAAGLAFPTVAFAAPKVEEPSASTPMQAPAAKQQRYCVQDELTGSRLAHRQCKTLDAWLATGFDPRAKK